MFTETFSMKDEAQKLEAYKKLETMLEDADAKLYALYPAMIRSYVALKDADNAARVLDLIVKGNAEPRELADSRLTVARAYYNSKTKLDVALDLVRQAVEQFRQPVPTKDGAELPEYVKENAKKQLADALQLNGQILLEKGNGEQAIASLNESVKLLEKEENLYDLGRAYNDVGKKDEAIDALSRAYAYEGKRQQEAKASLEKIYGSRAGATPLDKFLGEAVDRQRTMVREASIAKAVREMAKTEAKDAPTFTLATLAGQKVKLQDLRGKVLLLNFWATW
jgi:tetratricopeptide (TPR) repeat protein